MSPSASSASTSSDSNVAPRSASPTSAPNPPPQHRSRGSRLIAAEVQARHRDAGGDAVLVGFEQRGGFVEATLFDTQQRERRGGVGAMPEAARTGGPEDFVHRGLGFRPPARAAQHGAVRGEAVGVQHARPAVEPVEDHRLHERRPLFRAPHVTDAIARREHRAEALPDDAHVVYLSGCDRRERRVEPVEPLLHPALRDEREATVGERAHLQRAVVVLGRDRERAFGTGQEFVDVGALACHERELEVTPLRARSYLFEQQARALHPAVAGGGVAEGVRMQFGEVDRDPRRRAQLAGAAQTRERVLHSSRASENRSSMYAMAPSRTWASGGSSSSIAAVSRTSAVSTSPAPSAIPASSRRSVAPLTTQDRRGRAIRPSLARESATAPWRSSQNGSLRLEVVGDGPATPPTLTAAVSESTLPTNGPQFAPALSQTPPATGWPPL